MAVGGRGAEAGKETSPHRWPSAPLAPWNWEMAPDGRAGVENVWQARGVVWLCTGSLHVAHP